MKVYFDPPTSEPRLVAFDDLAPPPSPQPATRRAKPPARRRPARNWQKFVACYAPCMAGGALILYDLDGLLTAAVGLAIWLATMLIILATVPKERL